MVLESCQKDILYLYAAIHRTAASKSSSCPSRRVLFRGQPPTVHYLEKKNAGICGWGNSTALGVGEPFLLIWKTVGEGKYYMVCVGMFSVRRVKRRINPLIGQGVTKRCRLSWLTNSALVYEPKCGGSIAVQFTQDPK